MLAVTVDVEDWYHLPPITGAPSSKYKDVDEFFRQWNPHYDYLTKPTKKVLELLDDLKTKTTFFVVADVTEHYPSLVQQVVERGHEIACHGLHYACKIHSETKNHWRTKAALKSAKGSQQGKLSGNSYIESYYV